MSSDNPPSWVRNNYHLEASRLIHRISFIMLLSEAAVTKFSIIYDKSQIMDMAYFGPIKFKEISSKHNIILVFITKSFYMQIIL